MVSVHEQTNKIDQKIHRQNYMKIQQTSEPTSKVSAGKDGFFNNVFCWDNYHKEKDKLRMFLTLYYK